MLQPHGRIRPVTGIDPTIRPVDEFYAEKSAATTVDNEVWSVERRSSFAKPDRRLSAALVSRREFDKYLCKAWHRFSGLFSEVLAIHLGLAMSSTRRYPTADGT